MTAPETVRIAAAEEAQFLHVLRIVGIFALQVVHVELHRPAIDERSDELPVMEELDLLRRRIDELDIARSEIVWRQELAEEDHEIENGEHDARNEGKPVALELPPHEPPLRRHVDALLLLAHRLGGGGIEGRRRHIVLERLARRRQRCHVVHFVLPPCSLMRGSSTASARSEMRTPITVRKARNIRNEPARYMSWLLSARMSKRAGRFQR